MFTGLKAGIYRRKAWKCQARDTRDSMHAYCDTGDCILPACTHKTTGQLNLLYLQSKTNAYVTRNELFIQKIALQCAMVILFFG
jgi:hypothetical protein